MYTRVINLVCFVLALCLVGNVQAAQLTWTDAAPGDSLWSTAGNWDLGFAPTSDDWAKIRNGLPGPTLVSEGAVADRVHVGYDPNSVLTVDGGTLVISGDDLLLGKNGGSATLNMISGTITIARDLEVAGGDPGVINMTGGTIIVGDDFEIPESEADVNSIAEVHLDGGTIILDDSYDGNSLFRMYLRGTLNIGGGTLILPGDEVSRVQGYIDNGWITAYSGNGTVLLDYDDTNAGKTTLKAVHKFNPVPADGSSIIPGNITLSWTVDAGTLVDVWFTTEGNPDLWTVDDKIVSKQAVTSLDVTTVAKQRYFWAVDTYAPGSEVAELGPVFSFYAGNVAPVVDAGDNVPTWLDNGSADVALAATVTDTDPTTTVWTVVSEPDDPNSPDAVIADPAALNTSITLSALGEYVLMLEADDGELTGLDTVTINVYIDSCEAAKSLPGYVLLAGDLNADCIVDLRDFALMAANWLENNAL